MFIGTEGLLIRTTTTNEEEAHTIASRLYWGIRASSYIRRRFRLQAQAWSATWLPGLQNFLTLDSFTQRTFSIICAWVPSRVPASLCGSIQFFGAVALKPEWISLYLLAEFMSENNQDSATQRFSSSRCRFFILQILYKCLTHTSFPDWGDATQPTHNSAGIKNGFKINLCFLTFFLLLLRKRGNLISFTV